MLYIYSFYYIHYNLCLAVVEATQLELFWEEVEEVANMTVQWRLSSETEIWYTNIYSKKAE